MRGTGGRGDKLVLEEKGDGGTSIDLFAWRYCSTVVSSAWQVASIA